MEQFQDHCDQYSLLPRYQSAYRRHFSCETSLAKIMSDLLWNMEEGRVSAMLFMDLSAAFDTVDHSILTQVLDTTFGVKGSALSWFQSYLTPRTCQVAVEGEYSAKQSLTYSVPQGSCLGPILYTVYASTLQNVIPNTVDVHGYADDHAVKNSFSPNIPGQEELALLELSHTMDQVDSWMKSNRLKLNPDKTEFIMFGSQYQLRKCVLKSVVISRVCVPRARSVKHLGVILDQHLTMKDQIAKICRAAMINYQRIRAIHPFLTQECTKILVQGLVVSHLDYCNICLLGISSMHLCKLRRIQNMSAKLILRVGSRDSTTDCLKVTYLCSIFSSLEDTFVQTGFP